VQTITSSVIYSSGSNVFGNNIANTQVMTGSMSLTGSLSINGTSSIVGTGTTNTLPKFTAASTIGNSLIQDDGTTISITRTAGDLELSLLAGSTTVAGNSILGLYAGTGVGNLVPYGTIKVIPETAATNTRAANMVFSIRNSAGTLAESFRILSTGAATFLSTVDGTIFNSTSNAFRFSGNNAISLVSLNAQNVVKINAAGYWGTQLVGANDKGILIDNTGQVGIGTNTPNGNLEVYAATPVIISGASSAASLHGIEFRQSNTTDAYIKQLPATGELRFYVGRNSSWGGNMTFWTDTVQRMFISSGGEVRIQGAGSSQIPFSIYDGSSRRVFCIPSQYYGYIFAISVAADGGKGISFGNGGGASEVGSIVCNSSSISINYSSDYRLKEDLKDFNGIDVLSKVKLYNFRWKAEQTRDYGVIAHELKETMPTMVTGEKDALTHEDKLAPQGVDYIKFVPILIKAIQELKSQNDALQSRIETLESK
jgi:hypothetical protein